MMNNDMLQNIEYLREKANVSYEEAMALLENQNGNVMRVLVDLENQGRLYTQLDAIDTPQAAWQRGDAPKAKKEKAASIFQKVRQTRLIIEKKNCHGEKETVANIGALTAAGVTVFLPHFMFVAVLLTLVTGHEVRMEKKGNAA